MNKILSIQFGSTLYGTRTENSDIDIKGIYLPTAREIVLGTYKKTLTTSRPKQVCERNTKDDIDAEFFSLDRYLELLMQGQTVSLDMLFSPEIHGPAGHPIMDEIFENREKLLTRNVAAFMGYAKMQAAKYGIKGSRMDALKRMSDWLGKLSDQNTKLSAYKDSIECLVAECAELISLEKTPLIQIIMLKGPKGPVDAPHLRINGRSIPFHATVKYARDIVAKMLEGYGQRANKAHLAGGVDWKALSHAIRVNTEALELLETNYITFPRPDRELLLQIKKGELPYEQVAEIIEQGLANLYAAQEKSPLREKPDKEWADEFLCKIYTEIVKESK